MSDFLLDTDILSYCLKGRPGPAGRLRAVLHTGGTVRISAVTVFEITYGLSRRRHPDREAQFNELLGHLEVVPLTDAAARRAGALLADLEAAGQPLALADLLIAGTALSQDLTLVTNNEAHFHRVPGLRIASWVQD